MKKRVQVHALPTDKRTELHIADGEWSSGKLCQNTINYQYHYLYFTTDEKIQEGDWFLSDNRNHISEPPKFRVEQCIKIENGWLFGNIDGDKQGHNPDWSKKIVATTNPDLWNITSKPVKAGARSLVYDIEIAKIPTDFIQQYVKSRGAVKEVMLECEQYNFRNSDSTGKNVTCDEKLKLNADGSVIWSPAEEKVYSHSSVKEMCFRAYCEGYGVDYDTVEMEYPKEFEEWFNKNYPQ